MTDATTPTTPAEPAGLKLLPDSVHAWASLLIAIVSVAMQCGANPFTGSTGCSCNTPPVVTAPTGK